jgi:hypothetical protein
VYVARAFWFPTTEECQRYASVGKKLLDATMI